MKNKEESKSKILTYLLVISIIVILAIVYIFFSDRKGFNITLSPQDKSSPATPSQLKWHDSFKGIDNMK
ncbi:MAG: hypothetical protein RBR65_04345 [Aliarcobacter sp.]|jgi:amino acid permease|nr:hypothetical protein [Aliarcobacter sp.]